MMERIRAFFKNLWIEFKQNWKDILILIILCGGELFAFSSFPLVNSIPVFAVILVTLLIISIILFAISAKEKKMSKDDLKVFIIFVVIALALGIIRSYLYIASLMIAYLFYGDKKKLYKWVFITSITSFLVFILLCSMKIIPEINILRHGEEAMILNIRHTFGFDHPNQPLKFYLMISISGYLYLCHDKKTTLIYTLCLLPLLLLIGYHTNSRTGTIVNLLVLLLMNLSFILKPIKTKWLYSIALVITILLIGSYWINNGDNKIVDVLSQRPRLYNTYFKEFWPYVFFGKCYYPLMEHYNDYPLDNTFLYSLFDGGILVIIAIGTLFYKAFKDNEDINIKVAVCGILLYALTETLHTVFTNLLYIIMFTELIDIYRKNKQTKLVNDINKEDCNGKGVN